MLTSLRRDYSTAEAVLTSKKPTEHSNKMKLLPIPLSPLNPPAPLGIWGSDLLWRYPPAPPSPLADLKTQLPPQLNTDPRIWGREEVAVFLRFCEREFDLPKFDLDLFQMNGKALCVLTKNDLAERSPGAGDVLHNVLQMLVRDAQTLHRHLPNSPVTPTSRYPLSPHSHPPTPNWSALAPPDSPFFHNSHLQQFMAASNSVTLSPAPSIDSQAGSPPQSHQEQLQNVFQKSSSSSSSIHTQNSNSGGSSNQSDSDEDNSTAKYHPLPLSHPDSKLPLLTQQNQSPPLTPISKETQHLGQLQLLDTKTLQYPVSSLLNNSSSASSNNGVTSSTANGSTNGSSSGSNASLSNGSSAVSNGHSLSLKSPTLSPPSSSSSNGSSSAPNTPGAFLPVKREFFPDGPEPNTNGRLLWDFLQQLLNDPSQRYSSYIAWKCRDTGVFKIVDPAGLAKLWGKQKNHLSMNYDKMSRALRYYYRVNILRKVQGERHCYQFLRNPTELKSIKNISLLRQTMASQSANGQSTASAGGAGNHSLMSLLPNGANIHHLAAAAAAAAASHQQANGGGPISPSALHHPHHPSQSSVQSSASANGAVNGYHIKMETDLDEMKPTDLSTSDRKYYGTGSNGVDCYPLIRNANGLTTIQLLRQQQAHHSQENGSPPPSPSHLSLNSQSLHTISSNLHHLHQQQLQAQAAAAAAAVAAAEARHQQHQEDDEHRLKLEHDREHDRDRSPSPVDHHQQQQHHHHVVKASDDESMMPTDLSKSDSMYYK
ncbi:ets DNA-binding protein pokkuri [Armigeres subalbatus]|uniref:ets DNA-binding protein pokkuri n=1 Tax=Armigeres subalbatus TaxID=124917 RepID=UPI002ED0ECE2